jgi:plasmid maintenance system antidote protein VapI
MHPILKKSHQIQRAARLSESNKLLISLLGMIPSIPTIAERIGCTRQYLYAILNGRNAFSPKMADRCRALLLGPKNES